jgi:hypothetical protein
MTALYVGPDGPADPSSIDWAICLLQNPLGDPDPIAPACFVETSSNLSPLRDRGLRRGVSSIECLRALRSGQSSTAPRQRGQPAARPTDPDATGGFYLPVRA